MIEKRLLFDKEVLTEWGQYVGEFWVALYDHHWPVGRGVSLQEALYDLEEQLRVSWSQKVLYYDRNS